MKQDAALKLQAWLDEELSAQEADRVAKWVATDSEARQLVSELKNTRGALAGNELTVTLPETREFYWSKIERQIQRESQEKVVARPFLFSWRKLLIPVASAAAMVVLLFLSIEQFGPSAVNEVTDTSAEMKALTFHDNASQMTVVWLQDRVDDTQDDEFEMD